MGPGLVGGEEGAGQGKRGGRGRGESGGHLHPAQYLPENNDEEKAFEQKIISKSLTNVRR